MATFEFTVTVDDVEINDALTDRFNDAGCSDAEICIYKGSIELNFKRAAENLSVAINTALADIEKVGATIIKYEFIDPEFFRKGKI